MTELLTQHPLLACVTELGSALDQAADAQAVYLPPEQKAEAMRELARVEARLVSLRMRVMAVADDTAEADGSRDVAAWWSHHTRSELSAARADDALARSLDRDRRVVAAALDEGRCSVEQARVIVAALDELPERVDLETVELAESTLVGYAADFRPRQLRKLGERILHVVAPEIAEEEDARKLRDLERHAARKTRLTLRQLDDGTTRISGLIPDAAAERLKTYLESFTSPRHDKTSGTLAPDDRLPYPRRLGQAFCSLLEHLDPRRLPHHGGDATTVMVTVSLEELRNELGTAGLLGDGVTELSAGEARRLACTAHIVPVVLGGDSEILDLGRSRRLFSPAQRKALRLRDKRCRAEGCTIPATWTEAHHLHPWMSGGKTDLDDGILLCSHHHHRAHDARYTTDRLPNGDVRFCRRT